MNLHDLCKFGSEERILAYFDSISADSPDDLNYLIDLRNDSRYSPLHCAIFARNIAAVRVLVGRGADVDLKCHGHPPLHLCVATAILPGGMEFSFDCFCILLEGNANVLAKDDHGFSALHLAAEYNLTSFIDKLMIHTEDKAEIVNGAPRLTGVTPLHRAAASDSGDAVKSLLALGASHLTKTSDLGMTAAHFAGAHGSARAWRALLEPLDVAHRKAVVNEVDLLGRSPVEIAKRGGWTVNGKKWEELVKASTSSEEQHTWIVTNPLCTQHHTCPPSQVETPSAPPENIKRLHVLIDKEQGALCTKDIHDKLSWVHTAKPAALADVLRVHEWAYVRRVQEHCAGIASNDPENEVDGFAHLDGDTAVSCETYNAALAAAGAVCEAVDVVSAAPGVRRARNAFCPVRPPGHHAGPKGLVKAKEPGAPDSHGFCILNNVSIGAAYAMNRYRETVKKVAIVDFDVHHGNGTEETVRWLRPTVETTPISGAGGEVMGLMQTLAYKPWHSEQDSNNVMFVSVHGYGPRERGLEHMLPMAAFYPGTGRTVIPEVPLAKGGNGAAAEASAARGEGSVPVAVEDAEQPTRVSETMDLGDEAHRERGGQRDDDQAEEEGDDDSDGSYEDDKDQEDGESELLRALQAGAAQISSGDGVHRRVLETRRMYSTFAQPASTAAVDPQKPHDIPALILDIGVSLPDGSSDGEDRGKVLDELHYRIQWRRYFREQIFPRLVDFAPDMIFISAGFDAHKKDGINGGYIALVEEDFEWVTDKLVQLANSFCDGRIVSVLEGGYQLGAEHCSAFAQSAKSHVRALCNGTITHLPFSAEETRAETDLEMQHLDALVAVRQAQLLRKEQAREQAYLARLKEREAQEREAQLSHGSADAPFADLEAPITGVTDTSAAAEVVACESKHTSSSSAGAAGNDDDEAGGGGRKRRRQQVDYLALDKELRDNKQ